MSGVESKLKNEGFKVKSLYFEGSPADVIFKVSEAEKVDVIAMSTHGRSGPARWMLGSVAEHVVRHSQIPVLLIRLGE